MSQMTREYMEEKLFLSHPEWNRQTIRGWSYTQLHQVYLKETRKCVSFLIAQLRSS